MVTERQKHILRYIVSDYVHDAVPISSESLARNHHLGVSSATVRNEWPPEDQGLFHAARVAGSVPQTGYRLYVESFVSNRADVCRHRQRPSAPRSLTSRDVWDRWATPPDPYLTLLGTWVSHFPKTSESRVMHLEWSLSGCAGDADRGPGVSEARKQILV